jgi:hypothetical protein
MKRRALSLTDQSRSDQRTALAGGVELTSALPASNSISWKIMTAREVARHENVDPSSVRRWPARGCPVVRTGGRGPGRATLFNIDQVRRWRGRATAPSGMTADEAIQLIAAALFDSLESGKCHIGADCLREEAAIVLIKAFESCEQFFQRPFGVYEKPDAIRALMRISVE